MIIKVSSIKKGQNKDHNRCHNIGPNKAPNRGFSALEMSMTLLVISIIVVAIAKGKTIYSNARLNTARSLTRSSPVMSMKNVVVWYESTLSNSFLQSDIDQLTISIWYNLMPNDGGNPNNAIAPSAANQPTYVATNNKSGAKYYYTINNLPTLQFDGANNYMTFNATILGNKSDYTIIVVEQRLDTRSQNYFISSGATGASNQQPQFGYRTNTDITIDQWGNQLDATPVPGFSKPTPAFHIFRFSSAIGKNYYENGKNLIANTTTANALTGLTSYNLAYIALYPNNYYYGDIGEIIIFNRYITADEMFDVQNYLSKKWGIPCPNCNTTPTI